MAAAEGPLLEFEAEMFSSLFADDGLLVVAEGMGVDRVALQFVRLYSAQVGEGGGDGGSLVLVLNASAPQQEHFTEQLRGEGVVLPGALTGDVPGTARRDAYRRGGVLFVSSRVLVADLLTDRVPAHLVSGVLVCRAHRLAESSWCQEAFALRLFRQKNKTGFIKAFTDRAAAFSSGFCRADRVMRSLFVRKLYLWPRFQASVRAALDDGRNKPEVVELRVALTPAMRAIQSAVLDVMGACLKELKRYHPALEAEEDLTLENLLLQGENALENAVRHYLDPLWHQLGAQTKGLVHDLKTLRFLLLRLTEYDCVTFLNLLESLHAAQRNFGAANSSSSSGGWLFLDSCTSMFVNARSRVYSVSERRKRLRVASVVAAAAETGRKQTSSEATAVKRELVLEKSPKWEALSEVLREIETENQSSEGEPGRVLICASDDRACAQLQRYVRHGADALLRRLYERTTGKRDAAASAAFAASLELDTERSWTKKRRAPEKASKEKNTSHQKTSESGPPPTQTTGKDETIRRDGTERTSGSTHKDGLTDEDDEEVKLDLSSDDCYGLRKEPTMVIHPLRGCSDPYGLTRVLRQVAPRFVVLYDAELGFVRQLEIYAAGRPAGRPPLRVYFLVYAGSTEEQRYLTALSREKKAFEQLIREKATMVGPEEREGREEDTNLDLARSLEPTAAVDTRKAGGQEEPRRPGEEEKQRPRVVVDMRELGSELPSLLHRRGLDLQPVTLAVGDYVLADDTCVERKSVSDLIGSLRSGRLYGQCLAMTRCYKRAVLMIEFDTAARPFFSLAAPLMAGPRSSSSSSYPQQEMLSAADVTSRLALLTLHFPRLRMAWCASPRAAAELFREMKRGRPEPDVAAAQAVGAAGGEDDVVDSADLYNPGPYDLLLKMPGVDSKNYRALVSHADSLADLATFSQDRLARVLGNASNARLLYGFLHSAADVPAAPAQKSRHA